MDSLLASYASSDEEGDENTKPSSIHFSLPPPKFTLEIPENQPSIGQNLEGSTNPKRVVQFNPPINPYLLKIEEKDDEDIYDADAKRNSERKKSAKSLPQTYSVKSFLSSIPAPRNTIESLRSGSGRRSSVEVDLPKPDTEPSIVEDLIIHDIDWIDKSSVVNSGNEKYEGSWGNESTLMADDRMCVVDNVMRVSGKRGRSEIPIEIIEVKQDELIKNRPRENLAKSTGIAFGPSYQPVSAKGKPSKLHKRKHQIGSLYFDMKQKESELAERRSRGFLTKSETQAKYGW